MKKYIFRLLTLAVLVPALASCMEQLQDMRQPSQKRTVYFSSGDPATKTGLTIDESTVIPDWEETSPEDVHLFEMDGTSEALMGETKDIHVSPDKLTARFEAEFDEEDMTIEIGTPDLPGTKATGGGYTYGAVVAKMKMEGNTPVFYIPDEQKPLSTTLKDPEAEFLVGYSRDSYAQATGEDGLVVHLYFDRVAALSRIGFSNFQGENEKVMSVKINSETSMTGSATLKNKITFADPTSSVKFTADEGPGVLTLNYGEAGVSAHASAEADPFYAYFVSMPGTFKIESIEVFTDQYHYTKTVGKDVEFVRTELKNLAVDLSKATNEEISSNVWYKASVLEDGYDYLIVSQSQALKNNGGATAAVEVIPEAGIISFESEVDPTIKWTATAHVEMTGSNGQGGVVAGHFTLTNDGYLLQRAQEGSGTNVTNIIALKKSIPTDKPKYAVWDYVGNYLHHESSDAMTFYCYYNEEWVTGYTENGNAPGTDIKTVEIFTNRPPQSSISFEYSTYNKVLEDGKFTIEAQGNPSGAITYSSSNTEVATVNADTGEVTPVKSGTVVITATAAGSDTYQAAVASYTLTITSTNVTTWYKADEILEGKTYIVVSRGYALRKTDNSSIGAYNKEGVSFSGDSFQFQNAPEDILWIATGTNSSFTINNGGRYLRYNNNSLVLSSTSSACTYTGDYMKVGNYVLYCNNGTWTTGNSTSSGREVAFYTTTPPRQAQTLEYSATVVNYDANGGGSFTAPSLTKDIHTTVTYSSFNPNVASVDDEGNVVLGEVLGTTVITASAEGNESYKPAEASFILRVFDSRKKTRYVPISSIVAGKNYLIISSSSALKNNSGSVTSESTSNLTKEGEAYVLSFNEESNLAWFALAQTGFAENGHFSFSNGGYRLNRLSDGGNFSLTFVATSSAMDKYGVWDLQDYNGNTYLFHDSSSTMRCWVYYDGGWKITYRSSNTDPSTTEKPVQLYVEDGVVDPSSQKQERNLSFGTESFSYTLGETATFPTLSGVTDGVTYSSSDRTVATINASGVVSVNAAGTTIIKAEADEDDNYLAGSAQYTLTVSEAPQPTSETKYNLVTGDLSAGTYLIVGDDSGLTAALFPNVETKNWGSVTNGQYIPQKSVTASSNSITTDDSAILSAEIELIASGSNWLIKAKNGGYLVAPNEDYRVSFTETINSAASFSISNNGTDGNRFIQTGNYYFYHSGSASGFTIRTTRTGNARFYKKALKSQALSFSGATAQYDLKDGSWNPVVPTLDKSGAVTEVTYVSSNTAVVTVNASTGAVSVAGTAKKGDTATITATAAANEEYESATAFYAVRIVDSTPGVDKTYMKVTSQDELEANGTYLIVYENGDNSKVFKPIRDGNSFKTSTDNAEAVTISDNTITSSGLDNNTVVFHNAEGNKFAMWVPALECYMILRRDNAIFVADDEDNGYRATFTVDSGGSVTIVRDNSYYLRYSSSNGYFQVANNSSNSTLALYKLQ